MENREVVNKSKLAIVLNIVLIIALIILYGMYNLAVQESSEKDQALEAMRNQLANIYDASLDANEELAYLKQQQGYAKEAYEDALINIESLRDGHTDWREIAGNLESIYPEMGSNIDDVNDGIYRMGEYISEVIDYTQH